MTVSSKKKDNTPGVVCSIIAVILVTALVHDVAAGIFGGGDSHEGWHLNGDNANGNATKKYNIVL